MSIKERIEVTLRAAGLNPRCLAAVSGVHYSTVYKYIRDESTAKVPAVLTAVENALNKIENYTTSGKLQFNSGLTLDKKIERLQKLFAETDN